MQNFLNLQCAHSEVAYPRWALEWIDVKKLFSNWLGVRRCNINKMLSYLELEIEGVPHCGKRHMKDIQLVNCESLKGLF